MWLPLPVLCESFFHRKQGEDVSVSRVWSPWSQIPCLLSAILSCLFIEGTGCVQVIFF